MPRNFHPDFGQENWAAGSPTLRADPLQALLAADARDWTLLRLVCCVGVATLAMALAASLLT